MNYRLSLIFFCLPLLDLWMLFIVGETVPLASLFVICGLTGVFGFWLLQKEDFSLWTVLESELQNHRMPTEELLEAILVLFGGIALLLPGLVTDALGFALLIPSLRDWCISQIRAYLKKTLPF